MEFVKVLTVPEGTVDLQTVPDSMYQLLTRCPSVGELITDPRITSPQTESAESRKRVYNMQKRVCNVWHRRYDTPVVYFG